MPKKPPAAQPAKILFLAPPALDEQLRIAADYLGVPKAAAVTQILQRVIRDFIEGAARAAYQARPFRDLDSAIDKARAEGRSLPPHEVALFVSVAVHMAKAYGIKRPQPGDLLTVLPDGRQVFWHGGDGGSFAYVEIWPRDIAEGGRPEIWSSEYQVVQEGESFVPCYRSSTFRAQRALELGCDPERLVPGYESSEGRPYITLVEDPVTEGELVPDGDIGAHIRRTIEATRDAPEADGSEDD